MPNAVPESLLRSIVATYAPQRVILFGSAARGEAGPDSDLDLLVVLDDDVPDERRDWRAYNRAVGSFPRPVDIVTCRASVFAERSHILGSFSETISGEGQVVYERPEP